MQVAVFTQYGRTFTFKRVRKILVNSEADLVFVYRAKDGSTQVFTGLKANLVGYSVSTREAWR